MLTIYSYRNSLIFTIFDFTMRRLAGIVILVFAVLLAIIIFGGTEFRTNRYFCNSELDCTAEQCCHPTSAINKDFAPDCSDMVCTAECSPGTIDCGNGEIKCVKNLCLAVLK